jgi:C-terminal processing protease CtpA/Prc
MESADLSFHLAKRTGQTYSYFVRTLSFAAKSLLLMVILVNLGIVRGDDPGLMCGIGVVVAPDAPTQPAPVSTLILNHLSVKQVIPGGPAAKSGLQNGDEIIQVNDTNLAGLKFIDIVTNFIRGKAGTSVKITIKRNSAVAPLSFTIIRAPVTVYSAKP